MWMTYRCLVCQSKHLSQRILQHVESRLSVNKQDGLPYARKRALSIGD